MIFKKIRIQNFFSFGPDMQELDLSQPGMYLITGINKIQSGSNGSGKSSIFDAISYALFGQVTKKVNIPQIVNEQIDQDCMVELEFEADGQLYIIERWKKQKKHYDKLLLYKDDKAEENLLSDSNKGDTQTRINEIIKFNYKSFVNAVMMTQEQISGFLQADSAKKKEIIENILQLNVLTRYHWIAQQKRKIVRKQYEQIKLKEDSIDILIDNRKQAMQDYVNSCNEKKNSNKKEIEELKDELNKINQTDIEAERIKIRESNELIKKRKDLELSYNHENDKISSFNNEKENLKTTKLEYENFIKTAQSNINSFNEELKNEKEEFKKSSKDLKHAHDNPDKCPVCDNSINEDKFKNWKNSQLEFLRKIEENIKNKEKQINDTNININQWSSKKDDLQKSIDEIEVKIGNQRKNASLIKEEYEAIEVIETMNESELDKLDEKKKEIEQQIRDKENKDFVDKQYLNTLLTQTKQYASDKKTYGKELKILKHEFIITKWWEDSLSSKKNSMKSWCINNIIGYFNSKIKYYLDRFFDGAVSLQLDNDLNEVIKSNSNDRIYDMFSGGEKRRLNLAILFALNDLVKTNVSSKMNIMFLDEVLSNFLDDKGISSVLEILQDMVDDGNNSIFVIDHKDNFKDYPSFKSIVVIKDTDGFSRISQENNNEN